MIFYHKAGKVWKRTEYAKQCPHKYGLFFSGRCQGKKGHKGDHWMYADNGSYVFKVEKAKRGAGGGLIKPFDVAGGMIPPDHKDYISPIEKIKDCYLVISKTTNVKDKDVIAKLEKGKAPERGAYVGKDQEII